ncbi:MAG: hypothetical protein KDI17_07565 [Halioglobus sp.]|nr:hypothetical protein [Halioglobus sp.]
MSNLVEQRTAGQGRAVIHSAAELFRLRMESQCHHIKRYRLRVLRESGRLLTADEAAREWIERFAATFDDVTPD